jgi:hypothetical protein
MPRARALAAELLGCVSKGDPVGDAKHRVFRPGKHVDPVKASGLATQRDPAPIVAPVSMARRSPWTDRR